MDVTVLVYGMKQEIHWNILHEMEETKINFYIEGQASFPSPVVKYSFTSFTTTPDRRNTAIRFGIAIRPLKVSAIFHKSPRSTVAPRIATREYRTMNGLVVLELLKRNSQHLAP